MTDWWRALAAGFAGGLGFALALWVFVMLDCWRMEIRARRRGEG